MDDVTYQDEVVVYRVVARKARKSRTFMKQFKEQLKRVFQQEDVFIIARDVEVM